MSTEPYAEAIGRLRALVEEAVRREVTEPFAAALATADGAGRPSVRMVSVTAIEETGLLFFTDLRGGKGRQIAENPQIALCFFWRELHQQVTIDGEAEVLDAAASDGHWAGRPRDFQLAAWVSNVPTARQESGEAQDKISEARRRFDCRSVPRPRHWHAVRLRPSALRFWRYGWRHPRARACYVRDDRERWRKETVEPF